MAYAAGMLLASRLEAMSGAIVAAIAAGPEQFPDCEVIGAGLIAQTTAAWTSLAFVPVGMWVSSDRKLPGPTRAVHQDPEKECQPPGGPLVHHPSIDDRSNR